MINIFQSDYWKAHNKSSTFLLPLTKLAKSQKYNISTYLFWREYSIENYQLVLKVSYDNYDEFLQYAKKMIFPILDKKGYLTESFDFEKESVFILDMSEWALDIEMFLKGKYSKFSNEAKSAVKSYHMMYDKGPVTDWEILVSLDPSKKMEILDKKTPIEYATELYGLDLKVMSKIGEVTSIYSKDQETLSENLEKV
jgi:hypothetical protein